jgi:hypothetical protein
MTTVLRAFEANVVFALLMLWAVVYSHITNQRQAEAAKPAERLPSPWFLDGLVWVTFTDETVHPVSPWWDDAALDRLYTAVLADPWAAPDPWTRVA